MNATQGDCAPPPRLERHRVEVVVNDVASASNQPPDLLRDATELSGLLEDDALFEILEEDRVTAVIDEDEVAPLIDEDAVAPQCPICFEPVSPSNRFTASHCGHVFHRNPCMSAHLKIVATNSPQFPLRCPECRVEVDPQLCLDVLRGTEEAYHRLQNLILERQYHEEIRYCANVSCALPFDWFDDPSRRQYTDRFKVTCPLCKKATCVQCRIEWHEGKSCAESRVERDGTDRFRKLVVEHGWQPCPRCGQAIERRKDDCNYVRCRCGCGFCHRCGKEYESLNSTAMNNHGKPACRCQLFGGGIKVNLPAAARSPDGAPREKGRKLNKKEEALNRCRLERWLKCGAAPDQKHGHQALDVEPKRQRLEYWLDEAAEKEGPITKSEQRKNLARELQQRRLELWLYEGAKLERDEPRGTAKVIQDEQRNHPLSPSRCVIC